MNKKKKKSLLLYIMLALKIVDLIIQIIFIILVSGIYTKVFDQVKFLEDNKNYIVIIALCYQLIKFILSFMF